jgi:hypothetical protein
MRPIAGTPKNVTATGVIGPQSRPLSLLGFYVNSTTAGTIVLKNESSSGAVISGTITPAIGWHKYPISCPTGLHATIGGTLDVTFVIAEGHS